MDLSPKQKHEVWRAAYVAALSESAVKIMGNTGSPATGGKVAEQLADTAARIADAALAEYERRWGPRTERAVVMPESLTAENGAKGLMSGEFFVTAGEPPSQVMIPWPTIKLIYQRAVTHLGRSM
jgi:hypothetical protein